MEKEEVKKEETKKGKTAKIIAIVACVVVVLVVVVGILIFNIATIKTFKWSYDVPGGEGFTTKFSTVQKFRFGKPVSVHSEQVYDYTDAKWMDDEGIDYQVEYLKKSSEESCEKYDSKCKYTVKSDGRKINVVFDRKFTNKGKKAWLEENNYEEYIKRMDAIVEHYTNN